MPFVSLSQSTGQPSPRPLSEEEKRATLELLMRLESGVKACGDQTSSYEAYIKRDTESDEKERQNATRALEIEKQATALAEEKARLEKERAEFYKTKFELVTKKKGWGCFFKRLFTLGKARCI